MSHVEVTPAATHELERWRALRATPEIFDRMASLEGPEFRRQELLRREFPAELVTLGLLVADLRVRAKTRFVLASSMWFDRKGLEQATSEQVAIHKAKRFPQGERVFDICCGVGGDALALARRGPVTVVDADALQLERLKWNAQLHGVEENITCLHAMAESVDVTGGWIHVDPDRRPDLNTKGISGRIQRIEELAPPLEVLQRLMASARGGAIKLSPASNFGGKFPDAEVELISLGGECKEATIWFGELAGEEPFRATVLPEGETIAGHPLSVMTRVEPPGKYLFDPDPAVVRAGLVDVLADRLGLWRLDDAEEYLTGDQPLLSPFLQTFEIDQVVGSNERELKSALRERGYRELEIKCRHIRIDATAMRKKLPMGNGSAGVVIVAKISGRQHHLLGHRLSHRG
jgi:SAM-dependent methyltransferase